MGWAYGHDDDGREIGYSVQAECDHPGCRTMIDRGLDYRCGDINSDDGCGLHFCHEHQYFSLEAEATLCAACTKQQEQLGRDDQN